jgi:hypothetical protein
MLSRKLGFGNAPAVDSALLTNVVHASSAAALFDGDHNECRGGNCCLQFVKLWLRCSLTRIVINLSLTGLM